MSRRATSWPFWVLFVLGMGVCLGLAVGAYAVGRYSWGQLVGYKSPFVSAATPPQGLASVEPTPAAPLVRRVVLVIVDGLREDVSRSSMPGLDTLRSYGADLILTVPQPSLSHPNWTTILTGAPPSISGVTTNWYTRREPAPTIIDVARAAGDKVVVVGPTDFSALFGVHPGPGVSLRPWPTATQYLSGTLVDDALRLSRESTPNLVVVHLPDVDEAGHTSGGGSAAYRAVAARVDADISRLVAGLQGSDTAFVITADHGHVAAGGHGGWEPEAVHVPGVFAGAGVKLGSGGTGALDQVAPTIAVLLGLPVPAYAEGEALRSVVATPSEAVFGNDTAHHIAFDAYYASVVGGELPSRAQLLGGDGPDALAASVAQQRLVAERNDRLPLLLLAVAAALVAAAVIGVASWRALVSAITGTAVYYAVFEALYFWVHGYRWSLSVFNTDANVPAFVAWRLAEAVVAALLGVAVAALVYPLLRREPKGPQHAEYLPGHLSLAPATVLVILATLGVQVAWYVWWWGARIVWVLPDLRLGFKYGLDLAQMMAVGAAVLLAPLVTYLIGRYHPRVR